MRTNESVSKVLDIVAEMGRMLVSVALIALVSSTSLLTLARPAQPATELPTLAAYTSDAQAEGTDVLPVSFHDAPPELWNAMREVTPGFYDDDVPGIGTFYVPVGAVYDVPGGLYLATIDGFAECRDDWQEQECSATGPVQMLDIPVRTASSIYDYRTNGTTAQCGTDGQCAALDADRATAALGTMTEGAVQTTAQRVANVAYVAPTAVPHGTWSRQCVKAAQAILRAAKAGNGRRIEEDLSYRGMPRVVDQCNDELATAFYADGHDLTTMRDHRQRVRTFLRGVIACGHSCAASSPAHPIG